MHAHRPLATTLLVLTGLVLTACDSVEFVHPLTGTTPFDEQKEVEGMWLQEDNAVHVNFLSNECALLGSLEFKDGAYHIEQMSAWFVARGDCRYVNIRGNGDDGSTNYSLARYRLTDSGDLVVWGAHVPSFAEAVEQGTLTGSVERGTLATSVVVENSSSALNSFIDLHTDVFQFTEPLIFRRAK